MILILNLGSQSIKWKLFDKNLRVKKEAKREVFSSSNYEKILEDELNSLTNFDISRIGHRVVFGGEKFKKPMRINEKNISELEKFNFQAPLHNPFNLLGIRISQKVFPKAEHFAVFDTEFYSNLPPKAYIYPLPEELREKYGFRRFGFHGISHEYAAKEGAKVIGKSFNRIKIITCHLGGGSSITAVSKGKAVDTSMGYSPTEGVIMMTRAGDIDNEIIIKMAELLGTIETKRIINSESGLKAICQEKEMLEVLKKIKKGDKKAKLALDIFAYQVKKYIGAYFAALNGCDLLVFTGAIGAGSSKIRNMICKDLKILRNTKVLAIKANEELEMARRIKNI